LFQAQPIAFLSGRAVRIALEQALGFDRGALDVERRAGDRVDVGVVDELANFEAGVGRRLFRRLGVDARKVFGGAVGVVHQVPLPGMIARRTRVPNPPRLASSAFLACSFSQAVRSTFQPFTRAFSTWSRL